MRPSETKTIGDLEVTTVKLPSMAGSRLRFKLGKMLLPVLAGKTLADAMKLDISTLAPVLATLDEKTHDALMLEILVCTSVQRTDDAGKLIKFDLTAAKWIDLAFDGDVDALWATVWFALGVNLKGVFSASAGVEQQTPTP